MLWAKPGSGKTAIALTAVDDMLPDKVLIVGTKRIIQHVWAAEAKQWEHLQHCTFAWLQSTPKQRLKVLQDSDATYLLINYELLPWLADELAGSPWPFDAVIFDELSKMKTPGAKRVKKLRKPIQQVPVRIGLTGTPRGNSMLGLWSQALMTSGPVLGRTFTEFRSRWFYPVDVERRIWKPLAHTEEGLTAEVKPYAYAMPLEEATPEARINLISVTLPKQARDAYTDLMTEHKAEIEGQEVKALFDGVMRNKLLQITSGAVYTNEDEYVVSHTAKIDALADLVEELEGEQAVIFFRYRHELERIREAFPDCCTIDELDEWLEQKHQLIAVHPASAAHGLNMHVGGCCTAIWMTLPDSQELWEQGNRRLARKGQKNQVVSHVIAAVGTVEDTVSRQLRDHGTKQNELIEGVSNNG